MKILHVLDHSLPVQDGYAYRTLEIIEQQRKLGWETIHLTSTKHELDGPDPEKIKGLKFYRTQTRSDFVAGLPIIGQWDVVVSLRKRLADIIELERPDLLHAHSPSLVGMAAIYAGRKYGLRVVYECRAFWEDAAVDNGTTTEDSFRYRFTRALETRVFEKVDAVTCICEGLRTDIHARGVPTDKITVIPNAVDLVKFQELPRSDGEVRSQLELGESPTLGFIGSFYAWEGIEMIVQAMPDILSRLPGAKLVLVGGGKEDSRLRSMVAQLGVQSQVIFTGRVPHQDVYKYYDAIDLLVYPRPSMRLTETVTPLKPLEAMALGKNFIASDVGGHRELVQDGVTGRLFKAGDTRALTEMVVEMFGSRQIWPELVRNGRLYVERERTWANSVARYRPIYEGLLV